MTEFGSWLNATRKAMGFPTNSALARALDIPQPTISRWQSGAKPSVEHLVKVSELLGVGLKTLLILSDHMSGNADGVDLAEVGPAFPEGLVFVSREDLQSALRPAAGQDPLQLTSAILRLREACGLDDPDESAEVDHGFNGYRRGCRCAECREGNRVYRSAGRARRIERGKENPSMIPHGPSGYTNWDCRCKTCSWAGSVQNRKSAEKRKEGKK